ncbi:DUF4097 family beta strand repeat-containing protein [Haloarcula sp. GH36]|uniref:DUF4097 family beta strand repeat-containing protein n=1 Tax=Haloarcula montana TaxID=3111776 RepID=UPI002D779EC4|nr:DUF4097 family beta strand repeat-containing protein [Haloarcula sp. GH36]
MTSDVTRRRFLAGTALTALTAAAGCSGTTPFVGKRTESTETITVRDATTLTVETETGDVTLRGTDREDLHVRAVKQASSVGTDVTELTLETTRENGQLSLSSQWSGTTGFFTSRPSLDIDAEVPASLAVGEVTTSVGDIQATDVTGDLRAEANTGDVRVRRGGGTVSAESDTGDVEVRSPDVLAGASTNTGDVSVDVPAIDGETTVDANTGDVTAHVAPDLDATLVVQSSTGDVELTGLPLSDGETEQDDPGESFRGVLGEGGPTLRIESSTGDVTVRSL